MLKFFKGKDKGNVIYAPCKGRVVPLAEVPDPVFAGLNEKVTATMYQYG